LAKAGADIVVADIVEKGSAEVCGRDPALGRKAVALKIDVTDETSISTCLEQAFKDFPRIDILVNNAGANQKDFGRPRLSQSSTCATKST
jgi:meso-butanediol dehydrogenase / (S,S)-butanediol dehydrogenase / diacetyl reductase